MAAVMASSKRTAVRSTLRMGRMTELCLAVAMLVSRWQYWSHRRRSYGGRSC